MPVTSAEVVLRDCSAQGLTAPDRGKLGDDGSVTNWVFFHAHPDDEASQTSGTMAMAHERGDRVVEILATDGALGVVPDGLGPEELAGHRRGEHERAAEVIGIDRIVRLGFADSGMAGWDSNRNPAAFCNADRELVAEQVASILREEDADVFVHYDPRGNYGHPDHVMVHRVGAAAAALCDPQLRVLEETVNQDAMIDSYEKARVMGLDSNMWGPEAVGDDGELIGSPQSLIRWAVDLPDHIIATKHRALEAHSSQASDVGVMLSLPADAFALMFGIEYYREPADPGPMRHAWPM